MTLPAPEHEGERLAAVVAVVELGAVGRQDTDVVDRDGVADLGGLAGALDERGDDRASVPEWWPE